MPDTLYDVATAAMRSEIDRYLRIAELTDSFTDPIPQDTELSLEDLRLMAAGVGIAYSSGLEIDRINAELERKSAVPFDVERGVSVGVYETVRPHAAELYDLAHELTKEWSTFESNSIQANPEILPVLQHVGGIFSKSALKKLVGSATDKNVSGPASKRLSKYLEDNVDPDSIVRSNVLNRIESTLEGIVRDLVGRVLLEDVVAHALDSEEIPFMREDDYPSLSGVIYDFRADFVIPNPQDPIAFIEVRKSSSRHASLYAKDKMFSAINWKGRHENLIGVIVAEGDWTGATLQSMAKIYDYVVPLAKAKELAKTLRRAVDGDKGVLKWLVQFKIEASPSFGKPKDEIVPGAV